MPSMRSDPKMRIRSSCSDRKNFEAPGSPWRPETAAQLIVDAAALMPLGADDIQAAGRQRLDLVGGDFRLDAVDFAPGGRHLR